jgi:hypothetical protein
MSITIHRVGDLYEATVTPPHSQVAWSTPRPMSADALDRQLYEIGCHPTDVGDAFYEADPEWIELPTD